MKNNKYTLALRGSQLLFNECDMFGSIYKRLQTGEGFFVAVDEGRTSFEVKHASLHIKPSEDTNYIYAKWPKSGGKGELIHTIKEMADDSENYYILITSGNYSELNLK
jgi:hypothetical protein